MSARSELFSSAAKELVSYKSRDVRTLAQIGKNISAHQIGKKQRDDPCRKALS